MIEVIGFDMDLKPETLNFKPKKNQIYIKLSVEQTFSMCFG